MYDNVKDGVRCVGQCVAHQGHARSRPIWANTGHAHPPLTLSMDEARDAMHTPCTCHAHVMQEPANSTAQEFRFEVYVWPIGVL